MPGIQFEAQDRGCPICGANRLRKFKAYASDADDGSHINVVECMRCLFAWQYPMEQNEGDSVQFFSAMYADGNDRQNNYFNPDYKRRISMLEHEFVAGLPVRRGELLDIGAGAGVFAEVAAQHGWHVTAVDPALDEDRIRDNPRVDAVRGTTEQLDGEGAFDAVTMWDVIEHTTDPMAQICDARGFLKDGGWLIVETGNYKSVSRVKKGARAWIYQKDHRWFFAPNSLRYLLKEAGFSEFVLADRALRPDWVAKADYTLLRRGGRLLESVARAPLHLRAHLAEYAYLKKARDWEIPGVHIFTIAARKPFA